MSRKVDDLSEIQRAIASRLRLLRSLPNDAEVSRETARLLLPGDRLSPVEQLEVYRVQFWLRHTASLLEDFPGVSGILGQAEWELLVESYLSEIAPTSFSLRNLGARFCAHIEARKETPHRELCADMARLEWAYVEIFDAPDVPALDTDRLRSIPEHAWQRARFALADGVRLLALGHPVAALRRRLRNARSTPSSAPIPIPEAATEQLLVHRGRDRNLYYRLLSPAAFFVLQRLASGEPLVAACHNVASERPELEAEIERDIGAWFSDWGARGCFSDVIVD